MYLETQFYVNIQTTLRFKFGCHEKRGIETMKFSTLGLLSCACGLLLLGFQGLSALMHTENVWKQISITSILEPKYFTWMDSASWFGVEKIAAYLVTMPLFLLLIGIGVVLLIIGGIKGK